MISLFLTILSDLCILVILTSSSSSISILSSLPTQLTIPSYPLLLKFTKAKLCCQNILGSVAFSWTMVNLLRPALLEKSISGSQILCLLSQSLSAYVQPLCHVQKRFLTRHLCFLHAFSPIYHSVNQILGGGGRSISMFILGLRILCSLTHFLYLGW